MVAKFSGLAPKWLALGGGGYDVHAVARSWTTAYGVMTGQYLADEIPDSYRRQHGIETRTDHAPLPGAIRSAEKDARTFAEASVRAVQRMIFPLHGIRSG